MDQIQCIKVLSLSEASNQTEAFNSLISSLSKELDAPVLQELRQAVLQRESATSTYLDNGLAVPHGRLAFLSKITVSVGVSPSGINWPDGTKQAKLVVMLGVPSSMITGYLIMMQKLLKWHKSTRIVNPDGSVTRLEDLQQELERALS